MKRQLSWLRMGTALRFRRESEPSGPSRNSFAGRTRFLALLVALIGFALAVSATAATFTVDSTGDDSDPLPGDGICGTVLVSQTQSGGPCTLRAAIESANSNPDADNVQFNIPASDPFCSGGICTITLTQPLPNLSTNISINGPGADKLTVQTGGRSFRVFMVTTPSPVTLSGLTITKGTLSRFGGGGILNLGSATMNIANVAVTGNTASSGGGGILNSGNGTVNLVNSTISGNQAGENSSSASAGGIGNSGATATMTITNCTISGNSTNGNGGGVLNSGKLTVTNSTISNNTATGNGGGIYTLPLSATQVDIKSTIIAGNTASNGGQDVFGAFTSFGFNLIGKSDDSTGFTAATDQRGTIVSPLDPKLNSAGLRNNGGPTKTIALLVGSPAIDKGTSNGLTGNLTTDQRGAGFPRVVDDVNVPNASGADGADVGAFELQPPTVLGNISSRLRVETGDNILIGGFIVTGTQDKKLVIRALGPSLSLPDKLANPTLELRDSSGKLVQVNDDWSTSPNREAIKNSGLAPSNDLESAIIAALPADGNAYSAIVRGVGGATGTGVVEVYDIDRSVDSKLANISTRGLVQTGDTILIAGTIVVGRTPQEVIVRAIGPSLNMAGTLADPTLELRNANGSLIRADDNWRTGGQETEITQSSLAPTNDSESALIETLAGNGAQYTAIVRGVNNTTGIAVVEVYALQ